MKANVKGNFKRRRVIQWIIIVIGVGLIFNLSRDISRLAKASGQIKLAQDELAQAKSRNTKLLQQKKYYNSAEFIEEEARNKLNMARPGETIVILPKNLKKLVNGDQKKAPPPLPNWQKWWQLFFPQ